ncbi:MAG: amidohydrolase family protein [Synergistaceae bacterium]|nr:amidohydrolase family protein [Synergistaceae bacterium]
MKYYDFHSHLGTTSSGEANDSDMLVEQLRAYGVEKVGISNLTMLTMEERNDLIYDAKLKYPDFIRAYMYVSLNHSGIYDEIDKRLGDQKFDGCKIVTSRDGIRGDNCAAIFKVLPYIEKYGKVVQVFAGANPYCTPFVWADLAEKRPKLKLCFTHIACREYGFTLVNLVKNLPNVVVETSQQFEYFILKKAIDELGSERMLMGTDWPYKPTNTEISKFRHLGLTDDQLENIYYKNAARLWDEEL